MRENETAGAVSLPASISREQMNLIQKIAGEIRYGTITLVIQDGRLVQIDRSEKIRVLKNQG